MNTATSSSPNCSSLYWPLNSYLFLFATTEVFDGTAPKVFVVTIMYSV